MFRHPYHIFSVGFYPYFSSENCGQDPCQMIISAICHRLTAATQWPHALLTCKCACAWISVASATAASLHIQRFCFCRERTALSVCCCIMTSRPKRKFISDDQKKILVRYYEDGMVGTSILYKEKIDNAVEQTGLSREQVIVSTNNHNGCFTWYKICRNSCLICMYT